MAQRERVLSDIECDSAVWLKVLAYMEARLESQRARNDGNHDERKTARLRGSIAELKHLITIGDAAPAPPPEEFKE